MRSIRVLSIACATLLFGVLAPTASAASPTFPIHLVKDCHTFTADTPSFCVISTSDLAAIPSGTTVWYRGPVVNGTYFLSSNVDLESANGSTAAGFCMFDTQAVHASTGMCTFWDGTGDLDGFMAILYVSIDDGGLWHWDGTYHFAPSESVPRLAGRPMSPRPS